MQCLVVSASSSQTCLHNSVLPCSSFLLSLNLLTKLAMFTWLPLYFPIPFGWWSVRDFCCVLHMGMISTCVLGYTMPSLQGWKPCIFVIFVVTSTSMQSSSRDVADFRDLEFFQVISLKIFLCHVFLFLQSDPCLFWACSVRMISRYCYVLSIHVFVYKYGVP